ncbi:MAG: hypothetical protein FJ241_10645 [Nitrospira sp.]|nr:hypothetical protein [Nitrospira sp.]
MKEIKAILRDKILTKPSPKFCECDIRVVAYTGNLSKEEISKIPCQYCGLPKQPSPKIEELKTCNVEGFCSYRVQNGSLLGCKYEGYCDYQTPRDSRDKSC